MLEGLFQRVSGGPLGSIVPVHPGSLPIHFKDGDVSHLLQIDALQQIIKVVDGDGLKKHGVSCRIAGYDAPEIFRPRSRTNAHREFVRGQQAQHRLRGLIFGAVRLEITVVKPRGGGFGRDLVRVITDGSDIAETAKNEGWGRHWRKGQKIDWGEDRPLGLAFPDELPLPEEFAYLLHEEATS